MDKELSSKEHGYSKSQNAQVRHKTQLFRLSRALIDNHDSCPFSEACHKL